MTDLTTGTVYSIVDGQFTSDDGQTLSPGFQTQRRLLQLLRDPHRRHVSRARSRGCSLWTIVFSVLSVVDHLRVRTRARDGAQREADARPQDLPLARDRPVRAARVHDGARVARTPQHDVRLQPVGRARRRLARITEPRALLADPRQPVARLPVHVPGVHRRAAEHPDRPQGSGVRRRCDRADGVPQGDVPAPAHVGQPVADRELRVQLQQLHDRLAASPAADPGRAASRPARPTSCCRGRTASRSTPSPRCRGSRPRLSVAIFIIVAVLSAIGFKYTKTYEEVR